LKASILVNGYANPNEALLNEIKACDLIVCADGAATWAIDAGLQPHVLIGDMDSIPPELPGTLEKAGVEIIYLPREKDDTDAQAAIDLAIARGADKFLITGALGGRLDHTLGNIMLLVRLARAGKEARIAETGQMVMAACSDIHLCGVPGGLISIIPFGDGLFIEKTEGLAYPISHKKIPCDITLGISNVFTSSQARIEITSGTAIIIVQE
jgi:thiamine pyrophosphokinase